MADDKILGRIAALLRKAESTDNEHEADAYLAAAQRIATDQSVDLAVARAAGALKEQRKTPKQERVVLGESGKRGLKTYVELFLAIAGANDVTCDIAHNSTSVVAYGFDTDIDMSKALYTSILVQMVQASDRFIKSGDYKNETVARWSDATFRFEERPIAAATARINFQRGYADRIGQRLAQARADVIADHEQQEERAATTSGEPSGTELALRTKELEVKDFYQEHSRARGSWKGSSSTSGHAPRANAAGDNAGRRAQLSNEKVLGTRRKALVA